MRTEVRAPGGGRPLDVGLESLRIRRPAMPPRPARWLRPAPCLHPARGPRQGSRRKAAAVSGTVAGSSLKTSPMVGLAGLPLLRSAHAPPPVSYLAPRGTDHYPATRSDFSTPTDPQASANNRRCQRIGLAAWHGNLRSRPMILPPHIPRFGHMPAIPGSPPHRNTASPNTASPNTASPKHRLTETPPHRNTAHRPPQHPPDP